MILVEHAQQQVERSASPTGFRFSVGPAGVDVFLVISGFIACYTTFRRRGAPVDFWVRRIIRIVPLYWFCTGLFLLVYAAAPTVLRSFELRLDHAVKSFLFVPAFHPVYTAFTWPVLTPGWVLNYQMFFYFLFGVALLLPAYARNASMVAVLSGLAIVGVIVRPEGAVAVVYTSPLLLEIAAGMVIGLWFVRGRPLPGAVAWAGIAFAFFWFAVADRLGGIVNDGNVPRLVAWGVPSFLLVWGTVALDRVRGTPRIGWLATAGDASYSTYLTHPFVLAAFALVWRRSGLDGLLPGAIMLVAAIGVCHVGGLCGWRGLEAPVGKWLSRLWRSRQSKSANTGA